jgi:O-antigen/teichoic acid export membrane protein
MILVADKLRFQTGPMLVGAMISSSAVAYFAIGSKLVEYSTSAVRSMAIVFTPMFSVSVRGMQTSRNIENAGVSL